MDLKEAGLEGVRWINISRIGSSRLVLTQAKNLQVSMKCREFLTIPETIKFSISNLLCRVNVAMKVWRCVFSRKGLWDGPIPNPEVSYRLVLFLSECVQVCQ